MLCWGACIAAKTSMAQMPPAPPLKQISMPSKNSRGKATNQMPDLMFVMRNLDFIRRGTPQEKAHASSTLHHLVENFGDVDILKANGIDDLLTLVRSGMFSPDVRATDALSSALQTLTLLAKWQRNRQAIADAGGMELLIKCVRESSFKDLAGVALTAVAVNDDELMSTIVKAGGIEAFVAVFRGSMPQYKQAAAQAIAKLAKAARHHQRVAIAGAGGIGVLVAELKSGGSDRLLITTALSSFAVARDNLMERLVSTDGASVLERLARSATATPDEKKIATLTLAEIRRFSSAPDTSAYTSIDVVVLAAIAVGLALLFYGRYRLVLRNMRGTRGTSRKDKTVINAVADSSVSASADNMVAAQNAAKTLSFASTPDDDSAFVDWWIDTLRFYAPFTVPFAICTLWLATWHCTCLSQLSLPLSIGLIHNCSLVCLIPHGKMTRFYAFAGVDCSTSHRVACRKVGVTLTHGLAIAVMAISFDTFFGSPVSELLIGRSSSIKGKDAEDSCDIKMAHAFAAIDRTEWHNILHAILTGLVPTQIVTSLCGISFGITLSGYDWEIIWAFLALQVSLTAFFLASVWNSSWTIMSELIALRIGLVVLIQYISFVFSCGMVHILIARPARSYFALQAQAARSNSYGSECCVCLDEQATHAFVPCGHLVVCKSCGDAIVSSTRHCPICDCLTHGTCKVYLDL